MPTCVFSRRAFACIELELCQNKHVENGGVLLGTIKNDTWHIEEVVFSGPKAIHKSAEFVFDHDYTMYQTNMLSQLYDSPLSVLGIWHSHVTSSPFSYADEEMNLKFAELNDFGIVSCLIDIPLKRMRVYHVAKNGKYTKISHTQIAKPTCKYKKFGYN